jgi:hypothetical protein
MSLFTQLTKTGIVSLIRGDSFSVTAYINSGTELVPVRYTLKSTDKLYFAIMQPNEQFENAIVRKIFTSANLDSNGDVIISLIPTDTLYLVPGKYYYQLKLLTTDSNNVEQVITITPKSLFFIEE